MMTYWREKILRVRFGLLVLQAVSDYQAQGRRGWRDQCATVIWTEGPAVSDVVLAC